LDIDELALDEETVKERAETLLAILNRDRDAPGGLIECDEYMRGIHADPYMPKQATNEYKLLAKRSVTNLVPLVVGTPAQACYVDGVRAGKGKGGKAADGENTDDWDAWQRSGMDRRQASVYRGSFIYGQAFVLVERAEGDGNKARFRMLSPLRTAVGYDDPANDDAPLAGITVTRWPRTVRVGDTTEYRDGEARYWDDVDEYKIVFKSLGDVASVEKVGPHGNSECPIERFTPQLDLDGRPMGIVAPMIRLQDRINQTVFDLLIAQTYGSFKVRWATGMTPAFKLDPETGEPILGPDGEPIPQETRAHITHFMMNDSADAKFGTLDETPLDGYINAVDMGIRHLSALEQIPPHHLLGQIANLSADALNAAETALARKVEEFQHSFGESWERCFRLVGELEGNPSQAEDFNMEVIWRDMGARSLAQTADALGKLRQNLQVPHKGLWPRIPGVTQEELSEWKDLAESEPEPALAAAQARAVGARPAPGRQPDSPRAAAAA
jgi:hypothetical protein